MHSTNSSSTVPPASWFTRLADGLRRFGERRALQEMLARRSDRLLADIGYNRAELAAEVDATVSALQQERDAERQIRHELAGRSDGELEAMGITRLDIRRIARERARQAVQASRPRHLTARSA